MVTASAERSRLSIGAASEATELSIDTIRYYDKLGLLGEVVRDLAGRRVFTEDDLGWLRVLRCLRDTGMSMRDLRRFCEVDGAVDPGARRVLLEEHRVRVLARIEQLHGELEVLDGKLAAYRAAEAKQSAAREDGH